MSSRPLVPDERAITLQQQFYPMPVISPNCGSEGSGPSQRSDPIGPNMPQIISSDQHVQVSRSYKQHPSLRIPMDPLAKIFMSRQVGNEIEFLCSFNDETDFQQARWIQSSILRQIPNYAQYLQAFNDTYTENDYSTRTFRNSPLSPVEIVGHNDTEFLFRIEAAGTNVFVWDTLNGGPWDYLIHDYLKQVEPKQPESLTDGVKFLCDSAKSANGFIFEGEKQEVIDFLSICQGRVLLAIDPADFGFWCETLESRNIRVVGYRGDFFSRGVVRQFQMTKHFSVALIGFSDLIRDLRYLDDTTFSMVIFDKAETLRNENSRRANVYTRLRADTKGMIGTRIEREGFELLKKLAGPRHRVYFRLTDPVIGHIVLQPTSEQVYSIKAATSDRRRLKCCQHPLLVQIPDGRPRAQLLCALSSKFTFLLEYVKRFRGQKTVSIVFRNRKLRDLFAELLDLERIPYSDENSMETGVRLCIRTATRRADIVFTVDCYVINGIRIIESGTIEQKMIMDENCALVMPRGLHTLDENLRETGVISDYLPHRELAGYDIYITRSDINRMTSELLNCKFSGRDEQMLILAMLRSLDPSLVFQFPLTIYKLSFEIPDFDVRLILCNRKNEWLKPLQTMNPIVDSFKRFKDHFKRSRWILKSIESIMIVQAFNSVIQMEKIPPNCRYTSEEDVAIIRSLQNGKIMVNCEERIDQIVDYMRSELLQKGFTNRFCPQFWTKPEILQLCNALGEFGSQITGFTLNMFHSKTKIMSKTSDNIHSFALEFLSQIATRKGPIDTIVLQSRAPEDIVKCGIQETVSLTYDEYRSIIEKMETNALLWNAVDCMLTLNAPETVVGNYPDCTYRMCSLLFQKVVEFGISTCHQLLLTKSSPFRIDQSYPVLAFLKKKWPIRLGFTTSQLPEYFTNDITFQNLLNCIIRNSTGSYISPAVKEPGKDTRTLKTYQTPPKLAQRAAELQKRIEAEKKTRSAKPRASPVVQATKPPLPAPVLSPNSDAETIHYHIPRWDILQRAAELNQQTQSKQKQKHTDAQKVQFVSPQLVIPAIKKPPNAPESHQQPTVSASQVAAMKNNDFLMSLPHGPSAPQIHAQPVLPDMLPLKKKPLPR